ncbi:hypothetical protein GCM10022243_38030 [Saccharothrix violaceirubra]|uniref:Excreted virulence factor EspC (Type VII ESX diderm) n=1 Tax=Saccharothrix violaceirubra TaxID=413306 RepID=A0A7W7T490_9PSEU|nr:ESX-1 secretion-associated protein [Saccharothrix violaceirubra]MBB4966283.1 hypothetical protein [Saccharothrix violaceirubra]
MTDSYTMSPEELRGHAARLRKVQDRLDTALKAAGQVSLDPLAYGLLNPGIAVMVTIVSRVGVAALDQGEQAVADTIAEVRKTADLAEEVERGTWIAFRGMGR